MTCCPSQWCIMFKARQTVDLRASALILGCNNQVYWLVQCALKNARVALGIRFYLFNSYTFTQQSLCYWLKRCIAVTRLWWGQFFSVFRASTWLNVSHTVMCEGNIVFRLLLCYWFTILWDSSCFQFRTLLKLSNCLAKVKDSFLLFFIASYKLTMKKLCLFKLQARFKVEMLYYMLRVWAGKLYCRCTPVCWRYRLLINYKWNCRAPVLIPLCAFHDLQLNTGAMNIVM